MEQNVRIAHKRIADPRNSCIFLVNYQSSLSLRHPFSKMRASIVESSAHEAQRGKPSHIRGLTQLNTFLLLFSGAGICTHRRSRPFLYPDRIRTHRAGFTLHVATNVGTWCSRRFPSPFVSSYNARSVNPPRAGRRSARRACARTACRRLCRAASAAHIADAFVRHRFRRREQNVPAAVLCAHECFM
ncbi:hypothetical protein CNCMI4602_0027 [Bifidobacterium animalis subsp. animalis]|nr:hypothetical protein CNCMI4602_0027 [Bifidobacterium animalis subsp. animalis]KFI42019.1 hypothetical protein BASA_1286 [Bifidobacterium animalis subsp. animalis]